MTRYFRESGELNCEESRGIIRGCRCWGIFDMTRCAFVIAMLTAIAQPASAQEAPSPENAHKFLTAVLSSASVGPLAVVNYKTLAISGIESSDCKTVVRLRDYTDYYVIDWSSPTASRLSWPLDHSLAWLGVKGPGVTIQKGQGSAPMGEIGFTITGGDYGSRVDKAMDVLRKACGKGEGLGF